MLISFITVCFNSSLTIKTTIDSVLNQSDNDFEYLIIDGLSTDSTVFIANSYIDKFEAKKIKYRVFSAKDDGIYDAMNKGIGMANGKFICFINSDDWLDLDAVRYVKKFIGISSYDFVYGNINLIKNNKSKIIKHSKLMKHYFTTRYWSHPSSFISKDLYYKVGLYENKTIYDDWDLVLRIFKTDAKIAVIDKVLANFTMNGVSHSRGFKNAIKRARLKYSIYRKNGYSRIYWFECYFLEFLKAIIK